MSEAVLDFPFVEELPKREKSRLAKLWDHLAEVRAIQREHGMPIPVKFAADLAGVSHQRIMQIVEDGRLVVIEMQGHRYITENSFVEWAKSERKHGRPLKVVASNKELWKASREGARSLSKDSSK
jgi:hypothetical protein